MTRRQSLALGISKRGIERRLQSGRLHPVHRGVYLVGHTCPMPLAWETAALLACGRHAVLSHRSAALVWWALRPEDERYVEVTITRGARRCRYDVRVHESVLHPADVKIRHRLPITSPERTLIDLGREMDTSWIEWAVADGRRRGLLTRTSLARTLERAGPKTGVGAVKEVLRTEGGPAFTRSEAEARLARLLRRAGLPRPEQNVRVTGHEVDFLWRHQGLVVEVDGFAYHSGREAFERDRARDADLMAAGFRVLRITWRQLVATPERVVALVTSGLRPLPGPGAGRGLAALPR